MRFSHPPPDRSREHGLRKQRLFVLAVVWLAASVAPAFWRSRLTVVFMVGGWLA